MSDTTTTSIRHTTDDSFQQDVLEANGPVLVDFWAEWCGPCHAIAPVLEEIAETYEGRLGVAKLNIDENPRTPGRYAVRAIPTLMLFRDGQVLGVTTGVQSKSMLREFIDRHIR